MRAPRAVVVRVPETPSVSTLAPEAPQAFAAAAG